MQNTFFQKIKSAILAHKFISVIVALVIVYGSYRTYVSAHSTTGVTKYVLSTATAGSIETTVSGSGQVQSTNQINITAQVSGKITWVGVKPGDKVYAGQALASIDDTDAKQSYNDAVASLQQAQLQYQKDQATAPINYQDDINSLATAKQNLSDDYNNAFNTLSSTYIDLPNIVSDNDDIIFGYELSPSKSQANVDILTNDFQNITAAYALVTPFASTAQTNYNSALALYNPAVISFKQITRNSDPATIESMLTQTITMTTAVAQSLQNELNFLQEVSQLATADNVHIPSQVTSMETEAKNDLNTTNSDLSNLLSQQNTLTQAKQTINTDQQNITLDQIGDPTGNNPISLQISSSSIQKQEQDLETQREDLANYTITAPFGGTISAVSMKVGDQSSGTLASMVATAELAQISLNEVDAAKIALGDKATLTFDAINGLTIAGTVTEIDPVGTVSQGVVTYNVQIGFDTSDPRVKPGMSVDTNIITNVVENALTVPNGAVHTDSSGNSYVLVPGETISSSQVSGSATGIELAAAPVEKTVTVGTSNDTVTQILSGLNEGDIVISRTIAPTSGTTASASAAPSLLGGTRAGGGAGGFTGGATRVTTGR